jgi:hypothetical protein
MFVGICQATYSIIDISIHHPSKPIYPFNNNIQILTTWYPQQISRTLLCCETFDTNIFQIAAQNNCTKMDMEQLKDQWLAAEEQDGVRLRSLLFLTS